MNRSVKMALVAIVTPFLLSACAVGNFTHAGKVTNPLAKDVYKAAGSASSYVSKAADSTNPSQPATGLIRTGVGFDANGLQGFVPAPGSCHFTHLSNGEVGPDPRCTPGAADTAVTQANIGTTICRSGGYTKTVRAPESMTSGYKKAVMAAYGIPYSERSHYELDHLLELAAGGSNSRQNLWPEPNDDADIYKHGGFVHNDKDRVEQVARTAVCNGTQTLAVVQNAFASDWTSLIGRLGMGQ